MTGNSRSGVYRSIGNIVVQLRNAIIVRRKRFLAVSSIESTKFTILEKIIVIVMATIRVPDPVPPPDQDAERLHKAFKGLSLSPPVSVYLSIFIDMI